MGRTKDKTPKAVISMKIDLGKIDKLDAEAKRQGRPRANLIKFIIDQYLADLDKEAGKGGV